MRAGWTAEGGRQGDGGGDGDGVNRRSGGRSSESAARIDGVEVGGANQRRWSGCRCSESRLESMEAMDVKQQKGAEVAGRSGALPPAGIRYCRHPLPFPSHLSFPPRLSIDELQGRVAPPARNKQPISPTRAAPSLSPARFFPALFPRFLLLRRPPTTRRRLLHVRRRHTRPGPGGRDATVQKPP